MRLRLLLDAEQRGRAAENGAQRWNAQANTMGWPCRKPYAETGNQTFSVRVGHFYTIIGYEGVPSISNFFYSKSYAYQFAGPFTHWGLGDVARE